MKTNDIDKDAVIANLCSFIKDVDFSPLIRWDYTVVQEINMSLRIKLIKTFFKHKVTAPVLEIHPLPQLETNEICPVCNKLFRASELERHAGIFSHLILSNNRVQQNVKYLKP